MYSPSAGLGTGLGTGLSTSPYTTLHGSNSGPSGSGMDTLSPRSSSAGSVLYSNPALQYQPASDERGAIGTLMETRAQFWLSDKYRLAASKLTEKYTDQPITTLVPSGSGLYRTFIADGETAFKANDYMLAFSKFELANCIGRKDPDSLLSMSHAQFGDKNYALASYYLRER